jgi:hypothetical protein
MPHPVPSLNVYSDSGGEVIKMRNLKKIQAV